MATVKLTLSAEAETVKKAKLIARERGISVSKMFAQYVAGLESEQEFRKTLTPSTRKALGLVQLPPGKTDRELLEEALMEKYGLK